MRTLTRKVLRNRGADTARSPGDQRDLAGEAVTHQPKSCAARRCTAISKMMLSSAVNIK